MTTTTPLTEDDIYRTSSQYRLWSFTTAQLAAQRSKTHALALERAQRYSGQPDPQQNDSATNSSPKGNDSLPNPDIPTAEEELRLVQRYCDQIRSTSDVLKWPPTVKATAVQYLKRFYLSNSCMTYPPKEIYKTVLFLASKTEATHVTVSDYARRISSEVESVLAAEYKVMQALRFTLDVRQPGRGLKGVLMELLNMAEGFVGTPAGTEAEAQEGEGNKVREAMLTLSPPPEGSKTLWRPTTSSVGKAGTKQLEERIQAAYAAARQILDAPALLTDVYFLYTPSQILLAAMLMADEPLTSFYLSTKLPASSPSRLKILRTVEACAEILSAFDQSQVLTKDQRNALEARLERCRDPGTRDLVGAFKRLKQDGDGDEEKVKRRKLERETNQREGDELFGPSLQSKATNGANG